MLKLYTYFQNKIQATELRLSEKLERRLSEAYASRLFTFNLILLNQLLVIYSILADLLKYAIILTSDPGNSFNLFFKQRELRSCPYSYHAYKAIRTKIRIFSTAGIFSLIAVAVLSSLITNLIFGPKKPTYAATFGWLQTSFIGGATTTPAMHPGNQSGWSYFLSKDSSITITASGTVELGQVTGSTTQTSDTDFNAAGNVKTDTVVSGSGSGAGINLAQWQRKINEYTVGHLSNVGVTITNVAQSGPWLLTLSGTPNLSRIFKNDLFTDSAGKKWKVLSLNPSTSTPRLLVWDSETNGGAPVTGNGTVGRWYADLAAWETGRQGDLLVRNSIERVLPYYDVGPDTSPLDINGWTTDVTHYVEIFVPLSERHRGVAHSGRSYYMTGADWSSTLIVSSQSQYTKIDGIEVDETGGNGRYGVRIFASNVEIKNSLIHGSRGIEINASYAKIYNNILYDINTYGPINSSSVYAGILVYNNTISNTTASPAISFPTNANVVAKNNLVSVSGASFTVGTNIWSALSSNNISSDATSPNAGATDCGGHSCRNQSVTFKDAANKDFHLEFNDSAAKNAGADLSGDANIPFFTDIDGDTRTGTWDIGADDVGGTYVHVSSIGTNSRDFATLQEWEDGRDLILTTRMVFKTTGQTAAFSDWEVVTGQSSGATGRYIRERTVPTASEKYMSLDRISGNFSQGEVVVGGTTGAQATISSVITTAGTIEKGEAYNDSLFTYGVDEGGSVTDASHYLWLTVEPRSRHWGVAGTGVKVTNLINLSPGAMIMNLASSYSKLEWFEVSDWADGRNYGARAYWISNMLVHANTSISGQASSGVGGTYVINNILYNLHSFGISVSNGYLYNNTIYNTRDVGISSGNPLASLVIRNNITASIITSDYNTALSSYDAPSSNNISTDASALDTGFQSGINNQANVSLSNIKFVSTDPNLIDLHIMDGSVAQNAGANLTPTTTSDINLQERPTSSSWSIGADELAVQPNYYKSSGTFTSGTIDLGVKADLSSFGFSALTTPGTIIKNQIAVNNDNATWNYVDYGQTQSGIPIYYSVGQNTNDHKTGSPTVDIANGVATFSAPQTAPNMGVGDKVTYNGATVAYISGKISQTQWKVITTLGAIPPNANGQTINSIAHAFNSLYNAIIGAKDAAHLNTTDLASGGYQLNFPCYFDTGPDTTAVSGTGAISGYITSKTNFIRVYAPHDLFNEVNTNQRHQGKWDPAKYNLNTNGRMTINIHYIRIEGLQIKTSDVSGIFSNGPYSGKGQFISDNIIWGVGQTSVSYGIVWTGTASDVSLKNNIIYGFSYPGSYGIYLDQGVVDITPSVSNNTVYGSDIGIRQTNAAFFSNNISYNNSTVDFSGTPKAGSKNNFSKDNTANGTGPVHGTADGRNPQFVNTTAGSEDFHIQNNSDAKNAGADLSSDSNFPFSADIDGQFRISTWDIGADEQGASSVLNGRYVRYRTILQSTSDISNTPTLNDLTLNYTSLPAAASLISSPFNSNDAANILAKLEWVESLATSSDVTFQLRTSPDGAAWSPWLGPDGTGGTAYTDPSGSEAIPVILGDGNSDRWFQYQVTLHSDGVYSPTLSAVNVTYVVNGSPEIQIATSSPIYQSASGTIAIDYSVRDADTLTGKTPGTVLVGLDYCTANCAATGSEVWTSASPASLSGQAATTTVEQGNWLGYSLVWNPNLDFDGQVLATSSFKVRLTANDSEAANNVGYSSSDNFNLDTKNPDIASFIVNGAASSSNISVAATDDHNMQMEVSPNADFSGATPQAFASTSTYDLSAKPASLYLRLTDDYGNVSTSSVALPETPAAMMIQDNSNLFSDPNEYRLFIAWKVPANPVAGFDHYHIERSPDNSTWAELTQASNRTINYYGDSTTIQDQLYYYRVSVMDADGNVSYLSDTVSGKANGTQDAGEGGGGIGAAGVPPVISNVISTSTYSTSVTLEWETDSLSDSLAYYVTASGTDFSSAPSTGVATLRNDAANYGRHAVTLTNLVPSTTYYYIVKSAAINGASATSTEREFTTLPGPVIADDVQTIGITNSQAQISWTTDLDASSYVLYATSSELQSPTEVGTIDLTRDHLVTIANLAPGTTYYFAVKSDTARRDHADGQSGYFSFETTQDAEPPVISNVRCGHTADTTLSVLWDTNEPATGLAAYGVQTDNYASTTSENINLNLDHQFDLDNLLASTTYYFIVNSRDQNGYAATSTEYSCSTAAPIKTEEEIKEMIEQAKQEGKTQGKAEAQQNQSGGGGVLVIDKADKVAPKITNVRAENIKAESAEIFWITDEEANSFVSYSTTTTTENLGEWQLGKSHAIRLNNLRASSTYVYKVASMDASGNLAVSSDLSFTTPTLEEQLKQEGKTDEEIKKLEEQAQKKEEDKSRIILEAAKRAMDLVAQVANQVSLGTLEQALTGQFDTIEQLASVIPAPVLGGEPTVVTTPTTATISWSTDREANSMVAYAPENKYLPKGGNNAYLQTIGQADDLSKGHQVKLADLKPDTMYHFQLRSKGKLGPAATSRDFTFKTQKEVLEIINYASRVEGENKVAFQWSTNLEAEAEIAYTPYRNGKLAVEERKTESNKDRETIHNIILNQLAPGTVYQIVLANIDSKKMRVEKTIEQFSTTADKTAPEFITVQTESALAQGKEQRVQTVITWTTSEPTIGQLSYQTGVNASDEALVEKFTPETTYSKKHMALITKFQPGQIYTFRIAIEDYSGNKNISKAYTILAPRQKESVFQLILKNFEDIFGWVGKVGN
jgi:hypothetical protein